MSDFLRINKVRADQMHTALDRIEKSGLSQKALPAQYEELLGPVLDRIERVTEGRADVPPVEAEPRPSEWQSVFEMARDADLDDLKAAVDVYINRLKTAARAEEPKLVGYQYRSGDVKVPIYEQPAAEQYGAVNHSVRRAEIQN